MQTVTASGLLTGKEGRACISSMGTLPDGSRTRSAQVAPIARSTMRRSAALNGSRVVVECAPFREGWRCALETGAKTR